MERIKLDSISALYGPVLEPINDTYAFISGPVDGAWYAQISDPFIFAVSHDRQDVLFALYDEIANSWQRYVLADDSKLTPKAQALKQHMLATFREVK